MTERQKSMVWKRTQAHRDRFGRSQTREWYKTLMAQIQPVLSEISPENLAGLEQRIPHLMTEDPIAEQLTKSTATVGLYFAKETFGQMRKAMGGGLVLKLGGLPTDDQFIGHINYLISKHGGKRITSITGESRDQAIGIIRSTLQEGAKQGMGTSQVSVLLRDNMKEGWGKISTYRASRIARTETTYASNMGSLVGAKETKEPMLKVWLSTRDSRTRRRRGKGKYDHYGKYPTGPDGEKRELDEDFTKTGEHLQYPGDYAGSAGNVIHCRCTTYYEPKTIDQGSDVIEPPPDKPVKPEARPKPVPIPKPKPTRPDRITKADKIKKAKKQLADLENSPAYKKMEAEQLRLSALQNANSAKNDAIRIKMTSMRDKLFSMTYGSPEYMALQKDLQVLQIESSKLYGANEKIRAARMVLRDKVTSEEVAKILGMGEGSNLKISIAKGTGKSRAAEIQIFEDIMGNVEDEYGLLTIEVKSSKATKRAYCSMNQANVFKGDGAATVCHEMGHAVEHWSSQVKKQTKAFLLERCGGAGNKLAKIYQGSKEYGWEDKFMNQYSGKLYARSGAAQYRGKACTQQMMDDAFATEAFSMWWTQVLENPVGFVTQDAHYFEYFYDMILKMQGVI